MKSVSRAKPGYTSITCSKIEHIPYNFIFTTKFLDFKYDFDFFVLQCSSLKQQSTDKHMAPLRHIILIPNQLTSL